jgi:hypothetical protein
VKKSIPVTAMTIMRIECPCCGEPLFLEVHAGAVVIAPKKKVAA